MFFDKLAKLVEKKLPPLVDFVESAKLFVFDGVPHEVLPKELNDEEVGLLKDVFFLPFRTTAVEDKAGVVIIRDEEKGQIGIGKKRSFLVFDVLSRNTLKAYRDDSKNTVDLPEGEEFYCLTIGGVDQVVVEGGKKFLLGGHIDRLYMSDGDDTKEVPGAGVVKEAVDSFLINSATALQEVFYFNNPGRFVVESSNARWLRGHNKGRVRRSHERPNYVLLKPKEIRSLMKLPEPVSGRGSPAPHERRTHLRTLTSERFVNKRGQRILIPATWVGPSEMTVGSKHYKVLLNI